MAQDREAQTDSDDATPKPASLTGPAELPARGAAPLFLHRDTYRHRRLMDAARLLPLFGTALLLLPLLWAEDHATAAGAVYIFLAWIGLIVIAAVLSRRLSAPLRDRDRAQIEGAVDARPDGNGR